MRRTKRGWRTALMACSLLIGLSAANFGRGPAAAASGPARPATSRAASAQMSLEAKVVRDVYTRLMRYQSAAVDRLAAEKGVVARPGDYVTFEIRNIHTGPIEEVFNLAVADLVTSSGGEAIKMIPHHIVYKNGPSHSYYTVEWDTAGPSSSANTLETIGGLLLAGGDKYQGVRTYTSYEVTVVLGGNKRAYRALALHWPFTDPLAKPKSEIMDRVTPGMNEVLADESPRVRSPWEAYVKSPLYREVVKLVNSSIARHAPLIPPGAAIGYLPGDKLPGYEAGGFRPQADACAAPPHIVSVDVTKGVVGFSYNLVIKGTGFGASATVGVDGNGVTVSSPPSTGSEVDPTFTIAKDADPGNHNVTIKVGSQTSDNSAQFFVQIPTRVTVEDPATPLVTVDPGPGDIIGPDGKTKENTSSVCGAYRNFVYQLADQEGGAVAVQAILTERVADPPAAPFVRPLASDEAGRVGDNLAIFKTYPACPQVGEGATGTQTFSAQVTFDDGTQKPFPITTVHKLVMSKVSAKPPTYSITLTTTTP